MTGINTDGSSYSEQYSYISMGLPQSTTYNYGGNSYPIGHHYDSYSRPLAVTYPTGYTVSLGGFMKKCSIQEWRELFVQKEASSLSAAEFCNQNNVCPKYFSLRRKQLNGQTSNVKGDFVRVQRTADSADQQSMRTVLTLQYSAGQLVFASLPQPQWLAQLLKSLA